MTKYLKNAFDQAVEHLGTKIVNRATQNILAEFESMGIKLRTNLDGATVIDSTAVVIDDDVKALPAPGEVK